MPREQHPSSFSPSDHQLLEILAEVVNEVASEASINLAVNDQYTTEYTTEALDDQLDEILDRVKTATFDTDAGSAERQQATGQMLRDLILTSTCPHWREVMNEEQLELMSRYLSGSELPPGLQIVYAKGVIIAATETIHQFYQTEHADQEYMAQQLNNINHLIRELAQRIGQIATECFAEEQDDGEY